MGIYTVGCFLTIVLQCTDLRMLWDPTITGGTCWSASTLKDLSYTNQALNISTDIAFSIAIPVKCSSKCFRYCTNQSTRYP